MKKTWLLLAVLISGSQPLSWAQSPKQPKVAPGPGEPDWEVILRERYDLSMFADLKNPVKTSAEATPGLFRKAGPGPVKFTPVIALGLPSRTRGGWYAEARGAEGAPKKNLLWKYTHKNTTDDLRTGKNLPPPLQEGSTLEFDPADEPFGLWVANDEFDDGGVFTQPGLVAKFNRRLAKQPYKAMIYPNRDKATGKFLPHSYLIGWEYSTNDDFQDVVCTVDNVDLIADAKATATSFSTPWSKAVLCFFRVSEAAVRVCPFSRGSKRRLAGFPARAPA
jgi:hypothetical protein